MRDIYVKFVFLAILVVLISVSLLTYRNLDNYTNEVKLVRHSKQVVRVAENVLSSIKDAETGHRGYQLTRDSSYLEPYTGSIRDLPGMLKELDSLVADNLIQTLYVDTLQLLVTNQYLISSRILSNAERSSLYMDRYESKLLKDGKENMTKIRNIIRAINEIEENIYVSRVQSEEGYRNITPLSLLGYTILSIIGMAILFVRATRALELKKKAEKDMLAAERLSMTGKLARTIAHEVRNPLTNLNLALEHLRDEMPAGNEAVQVYGEIIERNAKRIDTLITEMLNSSKPGELNLELSDVNAVLDETMLLAADSLNLHQVKLEKDFEENLPRVLVDRDKLKIAFLNIIVNAIDAMGQGAGELLVRTIQSNGSVIVTITDNGKGIATEDIEKLFDPFFTGKPVGMGLGLTSTKNILNSHSASIDVESTVGKGTTFIIGFKLAG